MQPMLDESAGADRLGHLEVLQMGAPPSVALLGFDVTSGAATARIEMP
jgi:hypothetical protein